MLHILLVEDNPGDAVLFREALDRCSLPEHQISIVRDGVEAIKYSFQLEEYADVPRPDLVILDWILPKATGGDVLRALKSHPDLLLVPVVVHSNSDNPQQVRAAYDQGANCWIRKVPELDEYFRHVRAMIDFWSRTAQLPICK